MSIFSDNLRCYVPNPGASDEIRDIRTVCDEISKVNHVIANTGSADDDLLFAGDRLKSLVNLICNDPSELRFVLSEQDLTATMGSLGLAEAVRRGREALSLLREIASGSASAEITCDTRSLRAKCLVVSAASYFMNMDCSSGYEIYSASSAQKLFGSENLGYDHILSLVMGTRAAESALGLPISEFCDILSTRDARFLTMGRSVAEEAFLHVTPTFFKSKDIASLG